MGRTRSMPMIGRGLLPAPFAQAMFQLSEWGWRRRMRKSLGSTSERLLRDIGLTLDDLEDALGQPLANEASDALLKAAIARAGNW